MVVFVNKKMAEYEPLNDLIVAEGITANIPATAINIEDIIAATARAVLAAREQPRATLARADICSQIPQFGGELSEDVESWINRVDEIEEAYEVPENILKILVTKQLSWKATDWYNNTSGTVPKTWN